VEAHEVGLVGVKDGWFFAGGEWKIRAGSSERETVGPVGSLKNPPRFPTKAKKAQKRVAEAGGSGIVGVETSRNEVFY
jgi:hypothetical protein